MTASIASHNNPPSEKAQVLCPEPCLPTPYYHDPDAGITIYHGDCRDILPHLPKVDLVLTDPPYPNNAGYFDDSVSVARSVLQSFPCDRWLVFWDEMDVPIVSVPLVARHIWHRTNTNRPDNYEAIYEYSSDGKRRASRVFPYAVIYPNLTGCHEATGHPTQKNVKLIKELIERSRAHTILDPFMGSGTTAVACKQLHRKCIGIEIEEKYCQIAVSRLQQGVLDFGTKRDERTEKPILETLPLK